MKGRDSVPPFHFEVEMFQPVAAVRDALVAANGDGHQFDLETIADMFCNLTAIDEVIYVQYDVPATNPFWGGFQKWSRQPSAYAAFLTTVEIRYAQHLSEPWKRFVVCKELCHALEAHEGSYSVTDQSIDGLVRHFSLTSARFNDEAQDLGEFTLAISAEYAAEACAVEVLCPMPVRKQLLAEGKTVTEIADMYNLPAMFVGVASRENHMAMMEKFMSGQ